jgi:multimeric flavodoxin WrbA
MKVVAFNGSPRPEGNTALLLNTVLAVLKTKDIDTELVPVGGRRVQGCLACMKCAENKDGRCVVTDDPLNEYLDQMKQADGVILGSPVYFADVSAHMKALIERAGMVARVNGDVLKHKVGASVAAVRRAGSIHAFDSMNHFFLIGQMIVVGSSYWNMGFGRAAGEVKDDREGLEVMETLGRNMAWLLEKIHA